MHFKSNIPLFFIFLVHNVRYCTAQDSRYSSDGRGYEGNSYGAFEPIPIGLITDQYTDRMGVIFEHAIEVVNDDLRTPLKAIKEEVSYGDSFQAYKILCKLLQNGVGGVFGPSSRHTAKHLTTICDAKDVPYFFSEMNENSEAFNLYPHPLDFSKALYFLLKEYEWSRFIFLYESVECLTILNGLMSFYGNNGPTITVLRYDIELNGDYKTVLRRVRKSGDNQIVVVGSSDTMPEFLRQALQVGIINEDYKYIIGNLDFHAFDLEEFKYTEANITSFRMFSPEQSAIQRIMEKMGYISTPEDLRNGSCPITLSMALVYDSVQLFAETTKYLTVQTVAMNCSDRSESVLDDGSTFKNYMRTLNLQERTLTGPIYFEGNIRKGYTLDVIELQPSGILKIGTWDENSNLTMKRVAQTNSIVDNVDNSLANKTFTVLLNVPNKPYASLVDSYEKLEGNSQYEGYGVDLIQELAAKLGFDFILKNGGNDYGSYNASTNTTTGMLKEIITGNADLAITDLTITAARQQVVDFSIPFMNLGIAILHLKAQKAPPAYFTFMDPYSKDVWWLLGLSFLLVSFSFFILGRLSPSEWDNPYPCIEEPTELVNQFTIGNSLWFTTGALLQQGSEMEPKAISTRTVASFWWFFTLLMVSTYTANLAAFLTIENPTSLIDSIDDLAENKHGVLYGAKKVGSTREFFEKSEDPRHVKMNKFLNSHPDLLTNDNMDGVKRVDRYYAFLMESTSIEYNTMRLCHLRKVGNALDEKGYGIAMRKNWPYRDKFNNALLQLQEQGSLEKMKNKWWNEVGANICTSGKQGETQTKLKMENLMGIYIVLVVGSVLAFIYGIVSWIIYIIAKAKHYQVPMKEAFLEELKFALDFSSHTRILKSTASIYSRSRNTSLSPPSIEPQTKSLK
ncbi:glutamate receptor ionotropic, kainate 2 isoform X2 [Anastrepha ludens]|uniref:glutamate receptor ionotropic, kainate 2 isoform X2 n=1 Tax=Anastrepha ludens TaxID=28586 RepID=UPI0023B1C501|nr:glutamate receptor ionotropic, kainate 2 isoform X2 [Anastrepha ludens]